MRKSDEWADGKTISQDFQLLGDKENTSEREISGINCEYIIDGHQNYLGIMLVLEYWSLVSRTENSWR